MTVEIKPLYLGQDRYRIAVVTDGALQGTYPATGGTVAQTMNRLCEDWSRNADEVIPGEIPDATDMRTKGHQ